jgi:hypothetical protein
MRRIAAAILALPLPLLLSCARDNPSPYENPTVQKAIIAAAPRGWTLAEVVPNQFPWGHNRSGGAKNGGVKLILVGPQDVECVWRDSSGAWHSEVLAKESLELWIMPPYYYESLSDLINIHRPIPARLVHDGTSVRVYAQPSIRLVSEQRSREVLQQAAETGGCPRAPYNGATQLSWSNWQEDLNRALTARPNL